MNPPEYLDGVDPVVAHDWLVGIERVFQTVPCNEEEKVTFAAQMMKGSARMQWASASVLMITQGIPKYWRHFKTIVLDKYFLNNLRAQKEFEIQQLGKGNMSVIEYV